MYKVLIVEDAKMIQKVLNGIFSKNGYEVIGIANNGIEAVEKYFELKPDLMTMDIRMPLMDGLQALKEITFREQTSENKVNAKIMMVTSVEDDVKAVRMAGLYGASDYVKKPFKTDDLLRRVERVMDENYNFVKAALRDSEAPLQENKGEEGASYVIESDDSSSDKSVIDPVLKENLEEINDALNVIANDIISVGVPISGEKLPPFYHAIDSVARKLDVEHLKETSSFTHALANYLKRMENCGVPLAKPDVDLTLNAIDVIEDAIEVIIEDNGEDGLLSSREGKNMTKILKRL